MLNKKFKLLSILFISLAIIFFIIYKITFYTPPLLDSGKRNIIEQTIDFFGFSWHLSKSAFYQVFIRKDISKAEFPKAAWYRPDYIPKLMNTDDIDLLFMAKIYKENKSTNFLENTYISLLKDKIDDLNLLKEIEVFFLEKEEWKHLKKASERILLLDPNDLDSIYYLGLSYLNLNKLDKSKKLFERLVKLKPDFADAYYRLGLIYLKKKNYDRAQKLFEKTLDILPNHRDTLVHLKDLYKKNK
ncbi:MAG TPA: tetratricopeptide repeat protein [Candidatus Aminicenantes bacterium]|nr:tetratricopeptide repeat protein [Candidatus Aminicenantes bacterium]